MKDPTEFMDKFMEFAEKGEQPLEEDVKSSPGARFLQKGLNMMNEAITKKTGKPTETLKEDGDFGPKTRTVTQNMIQGLPPEMRRWAVGRIKKGVDDKRAFDSQPPVDTVSSAASEGTQNTMQNIVEKDIKS